VIKSREIRWAQDVARMEEMRNTHKILAGESDRKIPRGRPRGK
jgi:hypothetical protein